MNNKRMWLWLISLSVYLVFCLWYTNLAGPLSEEEIAGFTSRMEQGGASPERVAAMRRFMEEDTGRQFIMINALDMREDPPNLPATGPDATASDLINHYMEHMYPAQFARASHPCSLAGRCSMPWISRVLKAPNTGSRAHFFAIAVVAIFSKLPPTQPFQSGTTTKWALWKKPSPSR